MPRGWVTGKGQPKWHELLFKRWRDMWSRCNNPEHPGYDNYKDCKIDENYRYFSKYLNDIMQLENFDKLCDNPKYWHIDKDIKDPTNRHYYFEHLSIVYYKDNLDERFKRRGKPSPSKPVIGIGIGRDCILLYKSITDTNLKRCLVRDCCNKCYGKKSNIYKGYKWYYINYKHNKIYRRVK